MSPAPKVRRAFRILWLIGACVFGGCQSAPPAVQASPDPARLSQLLADTLAESSQATRTATALAAAQEATGPLADAVTSIQQAIRICEYNLANVDTVSYRATRTARDPAGKLFCRLDMTQGSLENTGRSLDVGISGAGFFKVKVLASQGDGFAYTRNGNFFVNKDGDIVLGTGDGYPLLPRMCVPKGTTDITISQDGKVEANIAGQNQKKSIGQITLHTFVNAEDLNLLGGSLFLETEASGSPTESKPGDNGAGQLLQGFLESSNVDPTRERLRIKFLQDWREMILKVIDSKR